MIYEIDLSQPRFSMSEEQTKRLAMLAKEMFAQNRTILEPGPFPIKLNGKDYIFQLQQKILFVNCLSEDPQQKEVLNTFVEVYKKKVDTFYNRREFYLLEPGVYVCLSNALQIRKRTKKGLTEDAVRAEVLTYIVGRGNDSVYALEPFDDVKSANTFNVFTKRVAKWEPREKYNPLAEALTDLKIKRPICDSDNVITTMKRFDMTFATYMQKVQQGEITLSLYEYLLVPAHLMEALHDQVHAKGYVHRDIKPANIFINLNPFQIVIGDASSIKDKNTKDPNVCYTTYNYASPQVLRLEGTSDDADIYGMIRVIVEWFRGLPILISGVTDEKEKCSVVLNLVHNDPYLKQLFFCSPMPIALQKEINKIMQSGLDPSQDRRFKNAQNVAIRFTAIAKAACEPGADSFELNVDLFAQDFVGRLKSIGFSYAESKDKLAYLIESIMLSLYVLQKWNAPIEVYAKIAQKSDDEALKQVSSREDIQKIVGVLQEIPQLLERIAANNQILQAYAEKLNGLANKMDKITYSRISQRIQNAEYPKEEFLGCHLLDDFYDASVHVQEQLLKIEYEIFVIQLLLELSDQQSKCRVKLKAVCEKKELVVSLQKKLMAINSLFNLLVVTHDCDKIAAIFNKAAEMEASAFKVGNINSPASVGGAGCSLFKKDEGVIAKILKKVASKEHLRRIVENPAYR